MKYVLSIFIQIFFIAACFSQVQIGQDLIGEGVGDHFGFSISMSGENTIAIGNFGSDWNGFQSGDVAVYTFDGILWNLKGDRILGDSAYDNSGYALSMGGPNTVAIGSYGSDVNGSGSGSVRVFQWLDSSWIQMGNVIAGEFLHDMSGYSVSMSDSFTVGIGAHLNDGGGFESGHARVFEWTGSNWIQKGGDLDGAVAGDNAGHSVSMPDSNTIAIGAPNNDMNGQSAGQVRVFRWNGSEWIQKGGDILGMSTQDLFGFSISMSDSNTIAIGAPQNVSGDTTNSYLGVYRWFNGQWQLKGSIINGFHADDQFGAAVELYDSNTVAVGAVYSDLNGTFSGSAVVCRWDGTSWVTSGDTLHGSAEHEFFGTSVSFLNEDVFALGAYGPFNNSGRVRIYGYCNDTLNLEIVELSPELIFNENYSAYQWLDCDNGFAPIAGETGQSFIATQNGSYAVAVTQMACTDTSACVTVDNVSVLENQDGNGIRVFPNPTTGQVSIDLGVSRANVDVMVFNDLGAKVLERSVTSAQRVDLMLPEVEGLYFIRILEDSEPIGNLRVVNLK